jgi:hypothetical protein
MANNGLPPGATLVSGALPSQPADAAAADTSAAQPSTAAGLPPGATLVSGTVPPAAPASDTGFLAAAKRDTVGAVSSMYHAFKDSVTPEEQAQISKKIADYNISRGTLDPKDPNHMDSSIAAHPSTATLAYHRLLDAPADQLNAKGDNELAAAKDLYDNQHKWAGVGMSMSGAVDKILAHVPVLGSVVNSIADRWESGDHIGALTDMGSIIALERLNAKLTGETAPKPSWVGKTTEAIAKPVGEVAGKTAGKVADVLPPNPFRKAVTAVTSKFTGSDIQPALKSGIQDVWNQVADKAGVAKPTAASVQDMGQEVGDSIYARSKGRYKLVDDATDNRFSGTEQALKSVNLDLRSVTSDAEEQALLVRKTRLEMQMNQIMDEAEAKGVPKETVAAAKGDFKQAQAIYDTNHQIRMSTTGVRPGMQGATDVPEEVNSKSLMNRLNKIYNKGRLQQAVGDDGAEDLIGHSAAAQKAARNVARNKTVAKYVAPAALTTAAGTAYELGK